MQMTPNFYGNRVCLNVLAGSLNNAIEVYEAAEHYAVVGILSKNYHTIEHAVDDMQKYADALDNAISIGLGAGDPNQSEMVSKLAQRLSPQHVNQVFTGVGMTRTLLNQSETVVNALVSPTGRVGWVNIATGPMSSQFPRAEVPVETVIAMLKDMGASSIKFFNLKGLTYLEEYREVANQCAKYDFYLEPTGGIDCDNFELILNIALDAGVSKIIPHVYSSIIDPNTGHTRAQDVEFLLDKVKSLII